MIQLFGLLVFYSGTLVGYHDDDDARVVNEFADRDAEHAAV